MVGDEAPDDTLPTNRQKPHLVEAADRDARGGRGLGEPVALEIDLVLEDRDLHEAERVVLRAVPGPGARSVLRDRRGGRPPPLLQAGAAERVRDPVDDDHREAALEWPVCGFARVSAREKTSHQTPSSA